MGLRLGPYVLSKFVPLAALGAVQCAILLGAVAAWNGGPEWWAGYAGLVLASWNGTAMGLLGVRSAHRIRIGRPQRFRH